MMHEADADLGLIQGRKVAIIGYGSQGHAHALNLRDSGVEVGVGLRPAAVRGRWPSATASRRRIPRQRRAGADVVMILAP